MRHAASAPLLFVVGMAAAFAGDIVVRLDASLHHAGWEHGVHTILLAVPAGILVALALRETRIVVAAVLATGGWAAGFAVLMALSST